ncbi:hypothetical protein [Planomonospora venezuelensis]|uniref:Uncharacterized protein n=1 Tax=Planomonospora venezuelensis TaxID=1999 RepID=A0A841D9P3_PLAVE|nr:hypothetical protein [Planomonospora venezuelensis]MBB5965038.1 hypothetical protein [Planomonospora venezuelensis]
MASKDKPKKPQPIVRNFDGPVTIRGTKVIVGGQVVSRIGVDLDDEDDE